MSVSDFEQFAEYTKLGWYLIPVYPIIEGNKCSCHKRENCEAAGKHPIDTDWINKGSNERTDILRWYRQHNRPNFGVITGRLSGVWVLDIDTKINPKNPVPGRETLLAWEKKYGELPDTPTAMTGSGGYHIFFKYPDITIPSRVRFASGLDVRSDRTQAVLAPSRSSAGEYQWQIAPGDLNYQFAEAPDWLVQLILSSSSSNPDDPRATFDTNAALEGVPEGERDETIWRLICKLRAADVPEEMTRKLVCEAADNCEPPFSHEVALEKVRRAFRRYQPNNNWQEIPQHFHQRPRPMGREWLPPNPITPPEDPEPFPTHIFPEWLRLYVEQLAESTQTPPDCAGMVALAILAVACARKVQLQIREDWIEPLNLFTLTAMPPASRKSAVFRRVVEPLVEYERLQRAIEKIQHAQKKNRVDVEKAKLRAANAKLAKATEAGDIEKGQKEVDQIAANIEILEPPAMLRLYVGEDITPEALVTELHQQGGRVAALSAEGGIFESMAGRYSDVQNLGVYLNGHAGDTIKVNRKGREDEEVYDPALTIGITIQPEVLRGLTYKPEFAAFKGRGLLGRFLYSVPDSLIGDRKHNPKAMEPRVRDAYQGNIIKLLGIQYADPDPMLDEVIDLSRKLPHTLHVSDEGQQVLAIFAPWVETLLRPDGALHSIPEWGGKLVGAVGRVAALLHMAENVSETEPWRLFIRPETIENACDFGNYLIQHALSAHHEMDQDTAKDVAVLILQWIQQRPTGKKNSFAKQEAIGGVHRRGPDLDRALLLLAEFGYIRDQVPNRSNPIYEVNPLFTGETTHVDTDHPPARAPSA